MLRGAQSHATRFIAIIDNYFDHEAREQTKLCYLFYSFSCLHYASETWRAMINTVLAKCFWQELLSACSTYFEEILSPLDHNLHPIIILKVKKKLFFIKPRSVMYGLVMHSLNLPTYPAVIVNWSKAFSCLSLWDIRDINLKGSCKNYRFLIYH